MATANHAAFAFDKYPMPNAVPSTPGNSGMLMDAPDPPTAGHFGINVLVDQEALSIHSAERTVSGLHIRFIMHQGPLLEGSFAHLVARWVGAQKLPRWPEDGFSLFLMGDFDPPIT